MDGSLVLRKISPDGFTEGLFRCVKAIDFDETADRSWSGREEPHGEVVEIGV
jgi:hypothetical protein